MVYVRLWQPSHIYNGLHGVVHNPDCQYPRGRNPNLDACWPTSNSVDAADSDHPGRRLFWCEKASCFGPDNSRSVSRYLRRLGRSR